MRHHEGVSGSKRSGRFRSLLLCVALASGVVATGVEAGASASATRHKVKQLMISVVKNKTLGTILVDAKSTVYTLKPSSVSCTTTCTDVWPAVVLPPGASRAFAGKGVAASRLGIKTIAGGKRQVTYEGRLLYRFIGDSASGEARGNGAKDQWGTWSVVVTINPKKPAARVNTKGSTTTTGAYSYGY